jgi:hypothetical protein
MEIQNPIQLLPIERNWRAVFVDPLTKEVVERAVIAWALYQPSHLTSTGMKPTGKENVIHGVVHMDGHMVPAGSCTNFVRYLEPLTTLDQYLLYTTSG